MTNRNAESMGVYNASWEFNGYAGQGNVGSLYGVASNRAAVIAGNAVGVFAEVERALTAFPDALVFGVNDVGMYLPKMDHWVSLHSKNLGAWKAVRWQRGGVREHTMYHSIEREPYIDYVWTALTPLFALSGYFAMQIAYIMDCDPIVLCGCPGSAQRRFFEGMPVESFGYGSGTSGSDNGVREQLLREMERLPEFRSRVASLSGWTREFFGGFNKAKSRLLQQEKTNA